MPVCEDAEAGARAPRLMDVDTETCSIALQHGSLEETAWSPTCAGMTVGVAVRLLLQIVPGLATIDCSNLCAELRRVRTPDARSRISLVC